MTSFQSLAAAALVSVALSTTLSFVIFGPLRALLAKVCTGAEAVQFWVRFSVIMLFLSPLLVSIVFGLPTAEQALRYDLGTLLQQIVGTALFGSFLSMLGMGLWISALIRRAPREPMASSASRPWAEP
jgi:hypothetical protein